MSNQNSVIVSIEYAHRVNFALQQNDVPVIRQVIIENKSDRDISNIRILITTASGIARPWESRLSRISQGETRRLNNIDFQFDIARLANLLEREKTELKIEVFADNEIIHSVNYPLEVLAFNEWPGLRIVPEIISAFVSPNHPVITSQMDSIRSKLIGWTGAGDLNGYQSGSRDRCLKMLAAVYYALCERKIGYINPPASFEQDGQKIRTADQVLENTKLGTCLDLAVVAAAMLESLGLHPLVLLIKEHAFVGVWLYDTQFSEPIVDDVGRISNRVALNEIAVFETTLACDGKDVAFDVAMRAASKHLDDSDKFTAAIDVRASRRARILPLPPRIQSGSGFTIIDIKPAEDESKGSSYVVPALDELSQKKSSHESNPNKDDQIDLPPESIKRLDRWKRKLLDLSLRNPLLNFRLDGRRNVGLLVADVAELENQLAADAAFSIMPKSGLLGPEGARDLNLEANRSGRDIPEEITREEFSRRLIRADVVEGFDAKMVELFRDARTSVEETGSNTLFLALGFLKWYETDKAEQPRYSPLLLVPINIERPNPNQYRIVAGDEDTRVNITLIEKLKQDFQLDASHLKELEEDESGVDVSKVFHGFRQVIKDMPRWEVKEQAYLGHFSFAKFVLWSDLEQRLDEIAKNPTVKYILTRMAEGEEYRDFPSESSVDSIPPGEAALCPLDADSSQQIAIESAIQGKTFVLQGPPGTGKSQTITNLIARAAASGKRVLFVAEKLAALSVVQSRLNRVGLAPYVLELHSNKVAKKQVLEQIRTSLEMPSSAVVKNWNQDVQNLAELRNKLNEYVQTLHSERSNGESVYEVISRLNSIGDVPKVSLKFDSVDSISSEQLTSYRKSIEAAADAVNTLGDVSSHPLRGIRLNQWRLSTREQANTVINEGLKVVSVIKTALKDWLSVLGVPERDAINLYASDFPPLYQLTKVLLQREKANPSYFNSADIAMFCKSVDTAVLLGKERDELRNQLLSNFLPSILNADHASWIDRIKKVRASNLILRWFKSRAIKQDAKSLLQSGKYISIDDLQKAFSSAVKIRELSNQLSVPGVVDIGDPGTDTSDWDSIKKESIWAAELGQCIIKCSSPRISAETLRNAIASLYSGGCLAFKSDQPARRSAEVFLDAVKAFQLSLREAEQVLSASSGELTGRNSASAVEVFEKTLCRWATQLDDLPEWVRWQNCIQNADPKILKPLFDEIDRGNLPASKARLAFELAYGQAWLSSIFSSESALNQFSYDAQTRLVLNFRNCDKEVMKGSQAVVRKSLASQMPASNLNTVNPNSELGILKRQLQLQRNHKSVRRLVKELPTILPKLKPIWLMSPLSVAQFLDPQTPQFDLVIFDEASQIPVWDAVGALARGKKAVIVGDSKQLPPTNFFQRQQDEQAEEDGNDVEELESILDECVAASIPELRLRWHYRSRHESLIAFSNHHYYENHLHTFPSADESTRHLGVSMRYLPDGRYDRGGSRTNEVEARAIVEEIFKRLASGDKRSLGVVTFSTAQQRLVEDLIDAELGKKPELKKHFDQNSPEYVFVKNLENVQGDERDVIFFSICYGITQTGRPSLGFGPLNRAGGERRLNVAITRARMQVIVFSSIKSSQINLSQSRSRGLSDLKNFLDYAERGPKSLLETITVSDSDVFDSPFEKEVCKAVRDRGWTVDTQVGCSGYRIDMAVRDPNLPGRYLLGIECDGASYHSAASARDRDRLREEVLRGLGWTLHRVWSTDWLQNRSRSLDRIIKAIETTIAEQSTVSQVSSENDPLYSNQNSSDDSDQQEHFSTPITVTRRDTVDASDASMLLPGAVRYVQYQFQTASRDSEQFYSASSSSQLREDIAGVIQAEAPIHVDELQTRVARAWGLQKITKRVESRFESLFQQLGTSPFDGFFRNGTSFNSQFRIPKDGEQRAIEKISPEEIRAAIQAVIASQGMLPPSDLEREVARLFGFQRVGEAIRSRIRQIASNNQS